MTAVLVIAWWLSGFWWRPLASTAARPMPNPALEPDQVIRTVVAALQHNDSPVPNAGIYTAYQFASPANRAKTGPYGIFLRVVKLPEFAPILSGRAPAFATLALSGEHAEQAVTFRVEDGRTVRFDFVLSRQTGAQTEGRCKGCWMVDAVNVGARF